MKSVPVAVGVRKAQHIQSPASPDSVEAFDTADTLMAALGF